MRVAIIAGPLTDPAAEAWQSVEHVPVALAPVALEAQPTEESLRRYVPAGQRAFLNRAHCNGAARQGRYAPEMKSGDA